MLGSVPVLWPGIFVQLDSKDGRDKQYDAVPPLTGPEGKSYTGYNYPSSTGYTFMLTNKASKEAQVAAIKMLDYIFTDEGQMITDMGPEGVGWTKPRPGDIALDDEHQADVQADPAARARPKNIRWGALAQYNNTLAYRNAQVVPTDIYTGAGYERRLFEATKLYEGHEDKAQWSTRRTSVWPDPSLGGELATLQTNLEQLRHSRTSWPSSPARRTSTPSGTPT